MLQENTFVVIASLGYIMHYKDINDKWAFDRCGFRLIDIATTRVYDYNSQHVAPLVREGRILNLRIEDGRMRYYNGSVERYPAWCMRTNRLTIGIENGGVNSDVILCVHISNNRKRTKYFVTSDYAGKMFVRKESKLVRDMSFSSASVANGKLVERNGKKFISAIEGSYLEVTLDELYGIKEAARRTPTWLRYTNNFKSTVGFAE
jgi:hypothetical protein